MFPVLSGKKGTLSGNEPRAPYATTHAFNDIEQKVTEHSSEL